MRRIAATAAALAALAGCGGGDEDRATDAAPTPGPPCPEGAELVRARDVIGPTPGGYVVVPGDQERLDAIAGVIRRGLKERWRDHDARVLARRGATRGTAVLVINTREAGEDTLRGIMAAERDAGRPGEPIEISGEPGRLNRSADGAYVAFAAAGECALVMLLADEERTLRSAASEMGGS